MGLKNNPRLYLKNRADRMVRLINVNAPVIIIENEFRLIEDAMKALRDKEGDTRGVLSSEIDMPMINKELQ
jgi:DNA-directed RNA polymerase beta' subunit